MLRIKFHNMPHIHLLGINHLILLTLYSEKKKKNSLSRRQRESDSISLTRKHNFLFTFCHIHAAAPPYEIPTSSSCMLFFCVYQLNRVAVKCISSLKRCVERKRGKEG